jgi:hypothetical protein
MELMFKAVQRRRFYYGKHFQGHYGASLPVSRSVHDPHAAPAYLP